MEGECVCLDAGALMESEIERGTELGKQVQNDMSLVNEILKKVLYQKDSLEGQKSYLLHGGYP